MIVIFVKDIFFILVQYPTSTLRILCWFSSITQTVHTVLRGKVQFYSKIALQIAFNIFFGGGGKRNKNFKTSIFTYIFSEMCLEQALTIHALLKEKMCPYKQLEATNGMSTLGHRNVSYVVLQILCTLLLIQKTILINKICLHHQQVLCVTFELLYNWMRRLSNNRFIESSL